MLTITIDDPRLEAGIAAAQEEHDASILGKDPSATHAVYSTPEAYLRHLIEGTCEPLAERYNIGIISSGAFVLRFTASEREAIDAAALSDDTVVGFLSRVGESPHALLYSDEVQQGIAYLVDVGLLTQQRADEVLSYSVIVTEFPPPADI